MGTPWHHLARVKGAGVDCAQFLIAVFHAVGLVPLINTGYYPEQWHLHRDEARFLAFLEPYTTKTDEPLPGDIVMFKYGRHAAHGAIALEGTRIIHAWRSVGCVVVSDLATDAGLAARLHGYYRVERR